MKVYNILDLDKNAVINIPLDPRSQPPASPVFGQIYTNSTDKNIQFWDGSKWIVLGSITDVTNEDGSLTITKNEGVVNLGLNIDNSTLEISNGVVRIKDNGVTSSKLASNSVTSIKVLDKNITFAKINDIPTMTVVGRVATGTGVSSAIPILNTNDLVGANGTSLVTSGAVKAYVDATIAGLGKLIGGYNASTSSVFPGGPTTKKSDFWYITTAGTIQGVPFQVGDVIISNKDNPTTTNANDYIFLQTNADQATTTVLGLVMLATSAEVQAGIENTKAITSAGLSSRTATEARTGIAKISTSAEAIAGTDDTTIMTPKKVKEVLATVTNKGFSSVFGTTALEYFITHGLNTTEIIAEFFEQPSNKKCLVDYTVIDATKIGVYFGKAPGANSLKVVIIPKG